jgi:hypothetical protein
VEAVCEHCRTTRVHEEIAGNGSISEFSQLILSLLAYAPSTLGLVWETVAEWADLADNSAIVTAVALAVEFWPSDHAAHVLGSVFERETLGTLTEVEIDPDRLEFEWDCNTVDAVALPVFPLEMLPGFIERIVNLAPDLALSVGIEQWLACA